MAKREAVKDSNRNDSRGSALKNYLPYHRIFFIRVPLSPENCAKIGTNHVRNLFSTKRSLVPTWFGKRWPWSSNKFRAMGHALPFSQALMAAQNEMMLPAKHMETPNGRMLRRPLYYLY